MTGIRKRVTLGFASIVSLLAFSGLISYFELSRLSHDTENIIRANSRNMELAREMLVAVDAQNRAFIFRAVLGRMEYDSLCRASMTQIEQTLAVARDEALTPSSLDSLTAAVGRMRRLTDNFLALGDEFQYAEYESEDEDYEDELTSLEWNMEWYENQYYGCYQALTSAVGKFMTSTENSLAPRTEQLKKNAYRAVTPVLISLVVVVVIVLMFHFFIKVYCVDPVLRMNESLGNYLSFGVPFRLKSELRDEPAELKDKIEELITRSKTTPTQNI